MWREEHPESGASLASLLEDPSVRLLYVDCRKDADALFHVHGIKQSNVYDLQVADAVATYLDTGSAPKSMRSGGRILSRVTTHSQQEALVELQRLGHAVHSCEGGTAVWETSPLHTLMVHYAASDVSLLHAAYHGLREAVRVRDTGTFYDSWIRRTSSGRVALAHTGSASMSKEEMWRHKKLISMVNPCMAATVPSIPVPTTKQAKRLTSWNRAKGMHAAPSGAGAGTGASAASPKLYMMSYGTHTPPVSLSGLYRLRAAAVTHYSTLPTHARR
jgi:hypothetical protein